MDSSMFKPVSALDKLLREYAEDYSGQWQRLRAHIPPVEIWRFFIDGGLQPKSWRDFEKRESGYLLAMCGAFHAIQSSDVQLTSDFVKQLHASAVAAVLGTKYGKNADVAEYREDEDNGFKVSSDTASSAGLLALLEANHPEHTLQLMFFGEDKLSIGSITINRDSVKEIKYLMEEIGQRHPDNNQITAKMAGFGYHLRRYCSSHDMSEFLAAIKSDQAIHTVLNKVAAAGTEKALAGVLYGIVKDSEQTHAGKVACDVRYESIQQVDDPRAALDEQMQALIVEYHHQMIKAKHPEAKLRAMVSFIQQCEQLHPFLDGNCRTFCMLLLDHLLIKNGFPPAILQNPNRFDARSQNELFDDVVHGMRQTLDLAKGVKIYKADTSVLMDMTMREDPEAYKYFQRVVAFEVASRLDMSGHSPELR